jgi:hypothetical protein
VASEQIKKVSIAELYRMVGSDIDAAGHFDPEPPERIERQNILSALGKADFDAPSAVVFVVRRPDLTAKPRLQAEFLQDATDSTVVGLFQLKSGPAQTNFSDAAE